MSNQQAIQLFQSLPIDLQKEVVDFMEFLVSKRKKGKEKPKTTVRKAGSMKGFVSYMAPDFDEPLEDFKDYM
jgi:hypothetical protein